MSEIQVLQVGFPPEIAHNWGWFLVLGIALVLLGIVAVVRSVTATVVSMLFFGWLLVIGGGIEIGQAFLVGRWAGLFQHLLLGVVFLITGLLIIRRPLLGAEVATLFMAMFFLISGVFQLVTSLAVPVTGWGWEAVNGAITTVLGVLILTQWPLSGLWLIGFFVGIDLMLHGAAWISLALQMRTP
jgi:uncharacterized membrane protein HdeD (DUF308 family)